MAAKLRCLLLVAAMCSASGQSTDVSTKPSKSSVTKQVNCAFDIYGVLLAAGKAGKAFYSTQKKCRKQDTEEEKRSCASSVQGLVASLGFVASFTAGSANACATSLNAPAICSGAASVFVSVLSIMGGAFSSFKSACADDEKEDTVAFRRLHEHHDAWSAANMSSPSHLATLPPSPLRVLDADMEKRIKKQLADKQNRQADITSCVLDVGLVSLFTGRGLMNVANAAQHSPCVERFDSHPGEAETACVVQVSGIIATFEFVASLLAGVAALCPIERHKPEKASCASDSLVVMAGIGALIQEGAAMSLECQAEEDEVEQHLNEELEGDIIP